jgi:hypothetical protein
MVELIGEGVRERVSFPYPKNSGARKAPTKIMT